MPVKWMELARGQLCKLVPPFTWVLRAELRFPGLHGQHLYPRAILPALFPSRLPEQNTLLLLQDDLRKF